MLNSPTTRWHRGFHFLLINEAMQGKHSEEDVGLSGLLSRAIVTTVRCLYHTDNLGTIHSVLGKAMA